MNEHPDSASQTSPSSRSKARERQPSKLGTPAKQVANSTRTPAVTPSR
jgi:hypothetical protein